MFLVDWPPAYTKISKHRNNKNPAPVCAQSGIKLDSLNTERNWTWQPWAQCGIEAEAAAARFTEQYQNRAASLIVHQPQWLNSTVGHLVEIRRVAGANPVRPIGFFFFVLCFFRSLAVNWTSANAGFAQCRASALASLSPVALPREMETYLTCAP